MRNRASQVLIVDSENDQSKTLRTLLEDLNLKVNVADNFDSVLASLNYSDIDFIFVNPILQEDIPGTLKKIKKECPKVQIIVTANDSNLGQILKEADCVADDYLEYPLNKNVLAFVIQKGKRNLELNNQVNLNRQKIDELKNAQILLNQLFEEIPCYISVQDKTLNLIASNRRFKEHFGEQINGYCYEIYKHRTTPCPECPVMETFGDGLSHSTEEIVTSKNGEAYNVLTQTAPIRNDEGEITQVLEISTNITEIRQLQDHLVSLGLMVGSMSHGVKSMLTALDGSVYQIETGLEQKDEARVLRASDQIKVMAEKIKTMVLKILYYAKSKELDYEIVDAKTLVKSVVNTIKPLTREKSVILNVECPQTTFPLEVDVSWMEATLVNFLENGIEACVMDKQEGKNKSKKKAKYQVDFIVEKNSDDTVSFKIKDNGIGMDKEIIDKMYKLFFTSKGSQGTGLGLFIANRIIKYHSGNVEVESKPHIGTTFKITIPTIKKTDRTDRM